MITIDCPFCHGPAATDERLLALRCDDCDVTVDVGADPVADRILAVAA